MIRDLISAVAAWWAGAAIQWHPLGVSVAAPAQHIRPGRFSGVPAVKRAAVQARNRKRNKRGRHGH